MWGTVNYMNYQQVELAINEKTVKNERIIAETISEIEVEQHELRMVQMVVANPPPVEPPSASAMILSRESARAPASIPPPPAATPEIDPMMAELQARIDALEEEKEELKKEKSIIKTAIEDSISVFSGIKVENPLVNAIIIPIFLYLIKKLLDFGFVRLEEWYEDKHGENA
jgi:hypothetical protein